MRMGPQIRPSACGALALEAAPMILSGLFEKAIKSLPESTASSWTWYQRQFRPSFGSGISGTLGFLLYSRERLGMLMTIGVGNAFCREHRPGLQLLSLRLFWFT
jgi:hypothetical protein